MRRLFAVALSLIAMVCVPHGTAQSKGDAADSLIHVRLDSSPIYKEMAAVSLASALLKKQIARNDDGSGSLTAVLLLTTRPGFACQSDPDVSLASEKEFIIGISLYEAFAAREGPEKTVLHQMLFSAPKTLDLSHPVVFQWKGETAVLFRVGAGESQWQSLKSGREENGLTISSEGGDTVVALDYGDQATQIQGRVRPTRCP